ncbi:hypothetical protein LUZ63_003654 [Rhynchospora breviuscula]|uniref:Pentatricopeptide repeat-containing protein n=1 Tax=Rhynchospora breviuscula TaxID=2022672 RepID=A0A9Q0HZL3_9POAL|nr:hypothetical protein LUZ63_003654 [Rhynchospora breviuscula]
MAYTNFSFKLANLIQCCIIKRSFFLAKSVHAQTVTSGLLSEVFLCNRLIQLYSECNRLDHAISVFDSIKQPNVYSWNAIFSAACKSNDLDLARQLFDQMPERDAVSWNTIISALVRKRQEREGLDLYYGMLREGVVPTHCTFASVLRACGSLKALDDGMRCHGLSIKLGLGNNLFVGNALVGMYVKSHCVDHARRLFDEVIEPNEVSFTSIMSGFARTGSTSEAFKLFVKMHRLDICIDPVAISSVLGAFACAECKEMQFACQLIQPLIVKKGFESDQHVGNSLIDLYGKYGAMHEALLVFHSLPSLNVVSWNILIAGFGQVEESKIAMSTFGLMQKSGFEPNEVTYTSLLSACVKSRDIKSAHEMFSNIPEPSVTTWNALLSGYCQEELHKTSINLFRKMQFANVCPDRTTLVLLLSCCSEMETLEFGKEIHSISIRLMLDSDRFVASCLIDMYSNCACIDLAKKVFERMSDRDLVAWNSMLSGLTLSNLNKEAFMLFKQMKELGLTPTDYTFASIINSSSRLPSLPQGMQMQAQTMKYGHINDVYIGTTLIDMYTKCGDMESAQLFFDCMLIKNIISWNEMIHGYTQSGYCEEALDLFDRMLERDQKPDSFTLTSVLTSCSRLGSVDRAMQYFNCMTDLGVKPIIDHYACIIDLLGRAGRFKEAEKVIKDMPFKDDPIVWEVLLSACAIHNNSRLGEHAAENLLRLVPLNPSPYIILANIYSGLGRYYDAVAVRELMDRRRVVKGGGCSWVDGRAGAIQCSYGPSQDLERACVQSGA